MNDIKYNIKQGSVYLEITSKCNLHCSYCYNDSKSTGRDLPVEKIKDIINALISAEVNNMAISGGEPFLHSDIFEIFEYAKKCGMHLYVVTNGSMLNGTVLKKLEPYMDILSFQITFDGFDCKTHAITRGGNNYINIMNFLSYMVNSGYTDRLFLRYNITSYNWKEIYDFLSYCANVKCKTISLSYILSQGRAENEIIVNDYDRKAIKDIVNKAISEFKELNIKFAEKSVVTCPYAVIKKDQELLFLPRIDSNGDVYPCQVEVDHKFIVGNIYNDELHDIMYSKRMQDYIAFITEKEKRNYECKNCTLSRFCGGGCVAIKSSCNKIRAEILHGLLYSKL